MPDILNLSPGWANKFGFYVFTCDELHTFIANSEFQIIKALLTILQDLFCPLVFVLKLVGNQIWAFHLGLKEIRLDATHRLRSRSFEQISGVLTFAASFDVELGFLRGQFLLNALQLIKNAFFRQSVKLRIPVMANFAVNWFGFLWLAFKPRVCGCARRIHYVANDFGVAFEHLWKLHRVRSRQFPN